MKTTRGGQALLLERASMRMDPLAASWSRRVRVRSVERVAKKSPGVCGGHNVLLTPRVSVCVSRKRVNRVGPRGSGVVYLSQQISCDLIVGVRLFRSRIHLARVGKSVLIPESRRSNGSSERGTRNLCPSGPNGWPRSNR